MEFAGDEALGETGIEIMDESEVDGGISGKTHKIKSFDNTGEESRIRTGKDTWGQMGRWKG